MNENITPKKTTRYKFLLKKPTPYTRHIGPYGGVTTSVKFFTLSYDRAYNVYIVKLYEEDEAVNWNKVMTEKFGCFKICSNDSILLEESELEGFLRHFGLK